MSFGQSSYDNLLKFMIINHKMSEHSESEWKLFLGVNTLYSSFETNRITLADQIVKIHYTLNNRSQFSNYTGYRNTNAAIYFVDPSEESINDDLENIKDELSIFERNSRDDAQFFVVILPGAMGNQPDNSAIQKLKSTLSEYDKINIIESHSVQNAIHHIALVKLNNDKYENEKLIKEKNEVEEREKDKADMLEKIKLYQDDLNQRKKEYNSILGSLSGYSKTIKLEASDAFIDFVASGKPINKKYLPVLAQGKLGKLYALWKQKTSSQITESKAVNSSSSSSSLSTKKTSETKDEKTNPVDYTALDNIIKEVDSSLKVLDTSKKILTESKTQVDKNLMNEINHWKKLSKECHSGKVIYNTNTMTQKLTDINARLTKTISSIFADVDQLFSDTEISISKISTNKKDTIKNTLTQYEQLKKIYKNIKTCVSVSDKECKDFCEKLNSVCKEIKTAVPSQSIGNIIKTIETSLARIKSTEINNEELSKTISDYYKLKDAYNNIKNKSSYEGQMDLSIESGLKDILEKINTYCDHLSIPSSNQSAFSSNSQVNSDAPSYHEASSSSVMTSSTSTFFKKNSDHDTPPEYPDDEPSGDYKP